MHAEHSDRRTWPVDVLAIIVAAIWGSSYLATKEVVTGGTVVVLLLLRFLISLPVLGAASLPRLRGLSRREVDDGLLLGVILAAEFLLETYGVVHTSATNAGLIVSCTMIFTPLTESLLTRTRPPATFLLASSMAVLGVGLLTQGRGLTVPSLGDVLILAAALTRTAYIVTMHRIAAIRRTDDAVLTFVQFCAVTVVMGIAVPYTSATPLGTAAVLSARQWLLLLYLALVCTLLCFFAQIWAVRRSSPSRVSLLLGTEPVWAVVTGVALGGDRLGVLGVAGVVLVLAGILAGRRPRRGAGDTAAARPDIISPEVGQTGGTWYLTVSADPDYFNAVMAGSGVHGQSLIFPARHPELRVPLTTSQVRIGRRHLFDGPQPEIDLSGPPRDPGVSRDHAVLASTAGGGWVIVDQGSTNGVLVDGVPAPPYVPVAVAEGTRIHIGIWTAVTLSRLTR